MVACMLNSLKSHAHSIKHTHTHTKKKKTIHTATNGGLSPNQPRHIASKTQQKTKRTYSNDLDDKNKIPCTPSPQPRQEEYISPF